MWTLETNTFSEKDLCVNESLYALGNGFIGVRACFEELSQPSIRGTYVNGLYDLTDYTYSEKLYGFPDYSERMPNVTECQTVEIYLDGEKVRPTTASVKGFNQVLDMKKGVSKRTYTYLCQSGKSAKLTFERLVSFTCKEVFIMAIGIEYDGLIQVDSYMKGDVTTYADDFDPRVGSHAERLLSVYESDVSEDILSIHSKTQQSDMTLHVKCFHKTTSHQEHHPIKDGFRTRVEDKHRLSIDKYNLFALDNRFDQGIQDLIAPSFETYKALQESYMQAFWQASDIVITGDIELQKGIRFNLFHLLQSVGKDGKTNIAAKGLTGEGYEGHTFWDTEIYIHPSFLYSQHDIAKHLLINRYNQLKKGKVRAQALGHSRGVKFPWRTITGNECSSFFPAGTAQYHINADVAYAVMNYYFMTDDKEFMLDYGYEMILETALLWLDLGHFYQDSFRIDAVTGPDEYSCVVNNNFYTNAMARENLKWAYELKDILGDVEDLLDRLQVSQDDLVKFKLAADLMYLPFDEKRNIHLQDDHFLQKKPWDFENTPKEKYPLLLHYHPLTIYRYQVLKQADTVLAHLLLDDFEPSVMKATYEYYENITTHDSSLSVCVYGMMASKIGKHEASEKFFRDSVYLDLHNTHKNTKDGLHMANLAGAILAIYKGFLGLEVRTKISLKPFVPASFGDLKLKLHVKNRLIEFKVSERVEIKLLQGQAINLKVYDQDYLLEDQLSVERRYHD